MSMRMYVVWDEAHGFRRETGGVRKVQIASARAVRALEERRWLRRHENARDRREEHLELTALGRRHFVEMVEMARAYERELAALLGTDGLAFVEKGLDALEMKFIPKGRAAG